MMLTKFNNRFEITPYEYWNFSLANLKVNSIKSYALFL